ncbi:unnamed protein product [Rangifer tarandus platyrhynchus]|uniref:Uncharacterized protein n=1 Tax=Rangifer tarandus platyrhynchus TaxID=3082113 RepID=A0AC59ZP74_RANTA
MSRGSPPSPPLPVVSLQSELEAFSLEPMPTAAAASLSLPRSVGLLSELSAFLWAFSNKTTGPTIDEACKHSTPSSARLTASLHGQSPHPAASMHHAFHFPSGVLGSSSASFPSLSKGCCWNHI